MRDAGLLPGANAQPAQGVGTDLAAVGVHDYDEGGAGGDEVLDVAPDEGGVGGEVCGGGPRRGSGGEGGDVQGVARGGEGRVEVRVGGGSVPAAGDEDEGGFLGGHVVGWRWDGGWGSGVRRGWGHIYICVCVYVRDEEGGRNARCHGEGIY